ncbi:MAG: GNAT family N-acetyltransferase [Sphingobacteriales bacterium]|nr:GNAT family N-acetyltransferase [Sphingobacteriales bacterium]MBI3719114.1 GNAT family N-acetyltransferase [Sphingobacteriales bacterium]
MAIRIIKATVNEANDIATTGRQSFYDAFHSIFIRKDELQKYLDTNYDVFKLRNSIENSNNLFFVAYDDDTPIGFAKLKQQSRHQQIQSAKQIELQKIYVLKEYHGTGISQTLLSKVMDAANELQPDIVWLNVHVGNTKARRFYEKNGFSIVGKHYYIIGTQKFEFDLMTITVGHTTHEFKTITEPAGVAHR